MIDLKLQESFKRSLQGAFEKNLQTDGNSKMYQHVGYVDYSQPTPKTQVENFKGVFQYGLDLRANAVADAFSSKSFIERQIGQREFKEVEYTHPWYQLLMEPNQQIDSWNFFHWMSLAIDLQGVANLFVRRNEFRVPIELLPIYREFGKIAPVPDDYGGVKHYVFYRNDGKIIKVDKANIIQVGRISPYSPYMFTSLLESVVDDLEVNNQIKDFRKKSLNEGGFQSPILTTPDALTPTQIQETATTYKQFVGKQNMGRVMVLQKSMKPLEMANARELQFVEGDTATQKAILLQLGITEGMYSNATTRATAEAARYVFAANTVQPQVNRITGGLTKGFEKAFGANKNTLFVRVNDIIPLNEEFSLRQRETYLRTGLRTINDYLREDGYDTVKGGDERVGVEPEKQTQVEDANRSVEISYRNIQNRIENEKRLIERRIEAEFLKWVNSVQREVKASTKNTRSIIEPFDLNVSISRLFNGLTPLLLIAQRSGYEVLAEITRINLIPFTANAAASRTAITQILTSLENTPKTLMEKIRKIVLNSNMDREALAEKLDSLFTGYKGSVKNLSNSLASASYNSGEQISYQRHGIKKKRWLSSRDENVRQSHIDMDGVEVGVNESFTFPDGEKVSYPADPNGALHQILGCRCSVLPVV